MVTNNSALWFGHHHILSHSTGLWENLLLVPRCTLDLLLVSRSAPRPVLNAQDLQDYQLLLPCLAMKWHT